MNRNYSDISYAESPFGTLSEFMSKTFGWMFAGLLVTFLVGIGAVTTGLIYPLITSGLFILTSIAELVLVFVLSARVQTLQPSTATGIFFAYAVLNGITFSAVFFAYDVQILLTVFALTSLYFGVLAAYGWFTKRDLSGRGPKLMGGLVALIVCGLVGGLFSLFGFGFALGFGLGSFLLARFSGGFLFGLFVFNRLSGVVNAVGHFVCGFRQVERLRVKCSKSQKQSQCQRKFFHKYLPKK